MSLLFVIPEWIEYVDKMSRRVQGQLLTVCNNWKYHMANSPVLFSDILQIGCLPSDAFSKKRGLNPYQMWLPIIIPK